MALGTAAIISLAGGAIGGGVNLYQAQQARDRQGEADAAAGRLMAEAKSKLEKDFYEGLKLPTDAYDQEYKANAQAQRQNIEALQQADSRTLAAGVGRVGALSNQQSEKIRATQAAEMFGLEKLKAEGKENMTQQLAQLDVAQAQDQAARAAQADEQAGALQGAAVNAFVGGAVGAAKAQPLESSTRADRQLAKTFDDNSQLFANNNISRSEFLNDPDKYKMLTSGLMIPTNKSGLLDQPKYPSFEPKLNYGFSANDRLASLTPQTFEPNMQKELKYDIFGAPI
tara:strand:- start:46 stop:897 length:852 start_codon:yes stop_codon:yes gene_type:complete